MNPLHHTAPPELKKASSLPNEPTSTSIMTSSVALRALKTLTAPIRLLINLSTKIICLLSCHTTTNPFSPKLKEAKITLYQEKFAALKAVSDDYNDLSEQATSLKTLLNAPLKETYKELHQQYSAIITLLRQILSTRLTGNDQRFTQDLCAAIYLNGTTKGYDALGETLNTVLPDHLKTQTNDPQKDTRRLFKACYKETAFYYHAKKWALFILHPKRELQSLSSLGKMRQNVASLFLGKKTSYDSHLLVANIPCVNTQKQLSYPNEGTHTVTSLFCGTPTIGQEISPEFVGFLEALRRNNEEGNPKKWPQHFLYTNYQNIAKSASEESTRSLAIMELSQKYSDVFLGITHSKDSSFYQQNEGWNILSPDLFTGMIGGRIKAQFKNGIQSFDDLKKKPQPIGLYYPITETLSRTFWETLIDKATDAVSASMKEAPTTSLGCLHYKQAFIEGVYSFIQKSLEAHFAKSGDILTANICKEAIDRAACTTIKDALLDNVPQNRLTGLFIGRALMLSKRLVMKSRARSILYNTLKYLDFTKFNSHLNTHLNTAYKATPSRLEPPSS